MDNDMKNIKEIFAGIDLSFDIPKEEKQLGHQLIQQLTMVEQLLDQQDQYLDIMYNPFKNADQTDPKKVEDDLQKNRGSITLYKNQIIKNNDTIQHAAAVTISQYFNFFESDSTFLEISNSFKSDIEDLHEDIQDLSEALDNIKSPKFIKTVVDLIDKIKTKINNIKEFITERAIKNIDTNILAKDWTKLKEDQNTQQTTTLPNIMQLVNERK